MLAADDLLEAAFAWVSERREGCPPSADVWDLRRGWAEHKARLREQLQAGRYRFGVTERVWAGDHEVEVWSAADAVVLKALSLVLLREAGAGAASGSYHLAGNGGAKAAVRVVASGVGPGMFVLRSDVRGYYASLDHERLMEQVDEVVVDRDLRALIWSAIRRTVYVEGEYHDVTRGIALGCPISPWLGALYLAPLDARMAELGLPYARFMDDWVVLAPTRWKLRTAVRVMNEVLEGLKVEKHPDKTFIGRVERGFDFLGYVFSVDGTVKVSRPAVERFTARATRLQERGADKSRIEAYARRWVSWVQAGVRELLRWDEVDDARSGWHFFWGWRHSHSRQFSSTLA